MHSIQPLATFVATASAGILSLILATKLRIPSILFLLVFGMFLGPEFSGLVQPGILHDNLPPFISLMVALILFEGSASLKFSQFRDISRSLRNLLTLGVLITVAGVAVCVHLVTGMEWNKAILFGAIMTVSGPTVVLPILRRVRIQEKLHNILKWEAILIDPLGVVLSVVLFEFLILQHGGPIYSLGIFAARLLLGSVLGLTAGFLMVFGLTNARLLRSEGEEIGGLYVLGMTLFVFGISEMILKESGLVAVTVAGVYFGNQKFPFQEKIDHFKDQVVLFALSVLFILLAANIPVRAATRIPVEGLTLLAVMIFIIRPLAVMVSTVGDQRFTLRDRLFLSFMAPRGIVSATLASLFAIALEERAFTERGVFLPLSFFVITGTILFYTAASPVLAWILGVKEGKLRGVMMVGAGPLGLVLGDVLRERGFSVKFIDTSDVRCRNAAAKGFVAYEGNGFDTDFLESLDIKGVGSMLALTPNHEVNVLSCQIFTRYLGRKGVFRLWDSGDSWESVMAATSDESWGRPIAMVFEKGAVRPLSSLESGSGKIRILKLEKPDKIALESTILFSGAVPVLAFVNGDLVMPAPGTSLPAGAELVLLNSAESAV